MPRVALGYKRCKWVGRWVVRVRRHNATTSRAYTIRTIALADDIDQPNGQTILSYEQARERALEWNATFQKLGRFPVDWNRIPPVMPDPPQGSRYTIAHAAYDYFRWRQINRLEIDRSLYTWNSYIAPEFEMVVLEELTTAPIWDWFVAIAGTASHTQTPWGSQPHHSGSPKTLEEQRRRRATANKILIAFKAILNHAYRTGRVENNTAWDRIKGFAHGQMPRQRYLSVDECQRLVQACYPDLRPLIEAGLLTGCRFGELQRLRVSDFITESGKLFIQITKRKRSRAVTLTERGNEFFSGLVAGRLPEKHLLAPAGEESWSTRRYYHRLQRSAQRAGVPLPLSFQALRRTYASHAAMAGVPLLVIANQLGHANTRTLEEHYAQLSSDYVDKVIRNHMLDLV